MSNLRALVTSEVYEDSPYFSDQLLLPTVAAGHQVTLVAGFTPSYLIRLVNDLASSPAIEPGRVHVIFCVPFQPEAGMGYGRLLSKYLSAFAKDSREVKTFLDSCISLVKEGGLSFGALFSAENRQLTPSCVGVIESTEPGSSDYGAFVDGAAGDLNSSIHVYTSWAHNDKTLHELTGLVIRAKNDRLPGLVRFAHGEVMAFLLEILQKGYPRQDLAEIEAHTPSGKKTRSSSPGRVKKSPTNSKRGKERVSQDDYEDEFDEDFDELTQDLGSSSAFGEREINKIIAEIRVKESGIADDYLDDFLGLPIDLEPNYGALTQKQHAGAMPVYLAEMVGYGYGVCWCGAEYDRAVGCAEYMY
jgi:hypothetical protein